MTIAANITRPFTARRLGVTAFAAGILTIGFGIAAPTSAEAGGRKACMQEVMSGSVNWGGGTRWERKNARALCKGARDHTARIGCFRDEIARGTNWSSAIQNCQSSGRSAGAYGGSQSSASNVNGRNVGIVRVATGTFEQRGAGWKELDASGRPVFSFDETHRDDWSVYLHDTSRNVRLQLDLHRDLVLYEGKPLYTITSVAMARPAAPAPKPARAATYAVEAGPIWNQSDASGKCAQASAKYNGTWTGEWWTTVQGKMSVCQITITAHDYKVAVEAGPIWNQGDANGKCAALAAKHGVRWTGHWWTTVQGEMSVCELEG